MEQDLMDLAEEYRLSPSQKTDLGRCLALHSKIEVFLQGEPLEQFREYGPRYFADSLAKQTPPLLIFEVIRDEMRRKTK
jgi:hypothetical protein